MAEVEPGKWYLCFSCHRCKQPIPIFEILPDAPITGDASFSFSSVPCPHCGFEDSYSPQKEGVKVQAQAGPKWKM